MKKSCYQNVSLCLLGSCLLLLHSCNGILPKASEASISRAVKDPEPYEIVEKSGPTLLDFDELTILLKQHGDDTAASKKMDKLFSTPFIDNTQFKKHGMPKPIHYENFGDTLRISTWNIEKSKNIAAAANALTSEKDFKKGLKLKVLSSEKKLSNALRQRATLAASDVLLCQEMDIGHCRSDYLFAAKHLADKLGMNFVYAPQQLEIDPVYLGLKDEVTFDNKDLSEDTCGPSCENHKKYKGVFGVAVLSRYPIKRVQVFPLKNDPYDWYAGEIQKPDFLEKLRRYGSKKVFNFKPVREVKVGGRGFTRVDLHVPGIPHETLSVINVHLEIKCRPKKRVEQLKEILSYIDDIKNPVVMAGDFNNAARDISSTSVSKASKRAALDPRNIATVGLRVIDATTVSQVRTFLNGFKNFNNPLAVNVPVIFPNTRKSLFTTIKKYRFKDGGAFDFRGDIDRSAYGVSGTLSNSNQRTFWKGFTVTFSTPRSYGPYGCDRLDWIFVKSFLTSPEDEEGSYKLAPHFGETLKQFNKGLEHPLSDHSPITTLLPLNEPDIEKFHRLRKKK